MKCCHRRARGLRCIFRHKTLCIVVAAISCAFLLVTFEVGIFSHSGNNPFFGQSKEWSLSSSFRKGRKVASISRYDFPTYLSNHSVELTFHPNSKYSIYDPKLPEISLEKSLPSSKKIKKLEKIHKANQNTTSLHKHLQNLNSHRVFNKNGKLTQKAFFGLKPKVRKITNTSKLTRTSHQDLPLRAQYFPNVVGAHLKGFTDLQKGELIQKRAQSLKNVKRGYEARVVIEEVTIPPNWTISNELQTELHRRKQHVQEVCHKRGLDVRNSNYTPNAWEFLANHQYHLLWCSVFKAASSTWFYNFNLLAGYSEGQLMKNKETPIAVARKKYPRLSVQDLDELLSVQTQNQSQILSPTVHSNYTGPYLSFMIARHPLDRLVSAFRDKLENSNRFYRKLGKTIVDSYPKLPAGNPPPQRSNLFPRNKNKETRTFKTLSPSPSFQQFVQFILDQYEHGEKLNEHWVPMNHFCTPCLVDFDVYAKVETLQDDGNYVIFKSGIEKIIKPKLINKSLHGPTATVTKDYMCKLSQEQREGLAKLYAVDMELFEYTADNYFDCHNKS